MGGRERLDRDAPFPLFRFLRGLRPRALGYFSHEGKVTKRSLKGAVPLENPPNDGGCFVLRPWRGLFCLPFCFPLTSLPRLFQCGHRCPYRFKRSELPEFFRQTVPLADSTPRNRASAGVGGPPGYRLDARRTCRPRGTQYSSLAPNVRDKGIPKPHGFGAFLVTFAARQK